MKPSSSPTASSSIPPLATRQNMARVLAATRKFKSTEVDAALNLPPITTAGYMAAATRYGKKVLAVK